MPTQTPILLDTDIGTDIDDVYALLLAAQSPELDLRAVTTVNNDTLLRARIARLVLDEIGRTELPVYVGAGASLTPGETRGWLGHEGKGLSFSDDATTNIVSSAPDDPVPAAARAIAVAAQQAHESGTPLVVLMIGAMTNLALALRHFPEETRRIGQVIAMASNFVGYGPENARVEHNVACDPVAVDLVARSGLPITLIGLNVTNQTAMGLRELEAIETIGGPLADALAAMHRIWLQAINYDRSPMHDGLTAALLLDPTLLTLTPAGVTVGVSGADQGRVRYEHLDSPAAQGLPICQVAVSVDAPRYEALLQSRVQEAVRLAKSRV